MADGDVSLRYRLLGSDEGASRAFDKVGRSSDHLHSRMTAVGVAIGSLAAGGVVALGALGAGAIKTGIETASAMQQASIGFTTLLGSAQKSKDFVAELSEFAKATPFQFPGLVDSARTLLGVGVAAKDVVPMLTDFGDAAGALAIQQDGFQRIMLATSQAISAGKFQAGDLNQINNNGLPVWVELSKAMHKPVSELRELASHGKLLASDVLPVLQAQMHKDYGGAMAAQSQTLSGLWGTMQDTFSQGMASVLMPLVPLLQSVLPGAMTALGSAFKGLADGVQSGIGWFQQVRVSMFQAFGDPKTTHDVSALRATVTKAFADIWAAVGPVLRQVWGTIQTQVVPALIAFEKAMIPVVTFLVKTLGPTVKTVFAAVLTIINGALQIIAGLFNVIAGVLSGDWSRVWAGIKQIASGAWQAIVGLFRAASATITGIFGALAGALLKLGANIMQGLLRGITAGAQAIWNKITEIANGIKDKFASILHISSPSRVMMKLGESVIEGVEVGLKSRAPAVYNFMEHFAQRIGNIKVTARVKDHLEKLATETAADMRAATAKLDKVKDAIKDQQAKVADLIKARKDYANTLAQGISGGGITNIGLTKQATDAEGNTTDLTPQQQAAAFLESMKVRTRAIHQFADDMKALKAKGLSQDVLQEIAQSGLETGGALASALVAATPETLRGIDGLSQQIKDSSQRFGAEWAGKMYDSGIKAAEGIVKGLQSKQSAILTAIRNLANEMVAEIKRTLKIKSPSGVMADEVGAMIPAGLVAGIQAGAGGVASAMSSLVRIPSAGTRVPLGAGIATTGGGAGVTNIHLHVPNGFVGSPDQLATALSDVISRAKARGLNLNFA